MHKGDIFEPNIYNKILVPAAHYNNKEDKRLLIPFTNGRNIGFMNKNNVVVTDAEYSAYYGDCYSEEDYIRVERVSITWRSYNKGDDIHYLEGLINHKGEEVFLCEFTHVVPVLENKNTYIVCHPRKGWAIITTNNKEIVPYGKYKEIKKFYGGFSLVRINIKWGIIDKTGNEVVPVEYDSIWNINPKNWTAASLRKGEKKYYFFFNTREIIPAERCENPAPLEEPTTDSPKEDDPYAPIPLMEFGKKYGKMSVTFKNSQSGDHLLKECKFTRYNGEETHTFVARSIQHYTISKIAEERENLCVVLLHSGNYCLCPIWEDVDFPDDSLPF